MATGRVCAYCVMDDSNPHIEFDEGGECDCCRDARLRMPHEWYPDRQGRERLDRTIVRLMEQNRSKPYDAMVGLSGGVDSAYLAHYLRTR